MPPDNNRQEEQEEQVFVCEHCEEETSVDERISTAHDGDVCDDCYCDSYYTCSSCGDVDNLDNSYRTPSDDYMCDDCFSDTCCHCDSCGEPQYHDDTTETRSGEWVCQYCYEDEGYDSSTFVEESPNSINVSYHRSKTHSLLDVHRLVGLEAECVFGDCPTDEEGHPIALGDIPNGYREAYDGSIEGNGREMISSPTSGDELYKRVHDLESWATKHSVYVNRSCGFHIHFDATDTTWRDLRYISLVAIKAEQHIYDMLPRSRQNSNWCKRMSMDFNQLLNCRSQEDFVDLWYSSGDSGVNREKYNDSRYHGFNLHARFYLGTIEFRYHSATLNAEKILNWIKLCNSIIETGIAMSRESQGKATADRLKKFYESYQLVDTIGIDGKFKRLPEQSVISFPQLISHLIFVDKSLVRYMLSRIRKFTPNADVFKYVGERASMTRSINNIQKYLYNWS